MRFNSSWLDLLASLQRGPKHDDEVWSRGTPGVRARPKPVNNIAGLPTFMRRLGAPKPEHRALSVTCRCEAEGEKGAKCRTWFGVKAQPIFACAGNVGCCTDPCDGEPAPAGLSTAGGFHPSAGQHSLQHPILQSEVVI
jgi:hypothetical protein